jgi:hypothetical protein
VQDFLNYDDGLALRNGTPNSTQSDAGVRRSGLTEMCCFPLFQAGGRDSLHSPRLTGSTMFYAAKGLPIILKRDKSPEQTARHAAEAPLPSPPKLPCAVIDSPASAGSLDEATATLIGPDGRLLCGRVPTLRR